jgi:hypothetical protein
MEIDQEDMAEAYFIEAWMTGNGHDTRRTYSVDIFRSNEQVTSHLSFVCS